MRGLRGGRVLVTGAAGGIGTALCRRLAEEGVRLGLLDRDAEGLARLATTLEELGGEVLTLPADLTRPEVVEDAVARFQATFGGIDGLVNNAGWDRAAPFLETGPDLWRQVVEINLLGPLHVSHSVLRRMREQGQGRLVSVASDAGRVGSSGEAVYAACKAGIVAWSKSVARELARDGIVLNVVSPGPTDTPLFASFDETGRLAAALARAIPMRRLGRPEDLSGAIAFLLSDDAAFITGQVISVSGGLTMHG